MWTEYCLTRMICTSTASSQKWKIPAAEAPNPSSPLRGNYVTKYLDIPWMYTMVESGKGNSHSESPPPIVDDDSDEPSDGNDDVNTTNNQRPAPSESKTTKPIYQKTSQSTRDTQKIAPTKQEISTTIFQATLLRQPRLGLAMSNKEQVT